MPRISATVGGVSYVVGGWCDYEIARRKIERDARPNVSGGSQSANLTSNNGFICSVLHDVRKQTVDPLKKALSTLAEKSRVGGVEGPKTIGLSESQINDVIHFLDNKEWPMHSKHLVKFKDALEAESGVPSDPITRVDPLKEKMVDPHNAKAKKDLSRKLGEYEVLLASLAEYVDQVAQKM